jgi:hypothetical protein|tara:strand:- start:763 stop:951 length:189 start_codon:yes stop_codon:yes gene_type:complete
MWLWVYCHNLEGKLPATINNSLRKLVDKTDSGMLLSIEYSQMCKHIEEAVRAMKDKLNDNEI